MAAAGKCISNEISNISRMVLILKWDFSYDHYGHEATEHTNPIPDLSTNDLQGHYSHHALAMAALNKTLQSRPKRRWSMKWAGRR